jgi:hypothetical protein
VVLVPLTIVCIPIIAHASTARALQAPHEIAPSRRFGERAQDLEAGMSVVCLVTRRVSFVSSSRFDVRRVFSDLERSESMAITLYLRSSWLEFRRRLEVSDRVSQILGTAQDSVVDVEVG